MGRIIELGLDPDDKEHFDILRIAIKKCEPLCVRKKQLKIIIKLIT